MVVFERQVVVDQLRLEVQQLADLTVDERVYGHQAALAGGAQVGDAAPRQPARVRAPAAVVAGRGHGETRRHHAGGRQNQCPRDAHGSGHRRRLAAWALIISTSQRQYTNRPDEGGTRA